MTSEGKKVEKTLSFFVVFLFSIETYDCKVFLVLSRIQVYMCYKECTPKTYTQNVSHFLFLKHASFLVLILRYSFFYCDKINSP